MPRRLHPDETALWESVAASVRPLPGRVRPIATPSPRSIASQPPPRVEPPRRAPAANRVAVDAATLDGGWDRKLRTGRLVSFNPLRPLNDQGKLEFDPRPDGETLELARVLLENASVDELTLAMVRRQLGLRRG